MPLVCSKCHKEVPDRYLSCMACLLEAEKKERLRRIAKSVDEADFYKRDYTTHIYVPDGKTQAKHPGKRYALCGIMPRRTDSIHMYARTTVKDEGQYDKLCRDCLRILEQA